jgi:hypothetical protein
MVLTTNNACYVVLFIESRTSLVRKTHELEPTHQYHTKLAVPLGSNKYRLSKYMRVSTKKSVECTLGICSRLQTRSLYYESHLLKEHWKQ